jgi:hypothetical protein
VALMCAHYASYEWVISIKRDSWKFIWSWNNWKMRQCGFIPIWRLLGSYTRTKNSR